MYCAGCKTEILSEFKHALSSNICPACGGDIMDEESLVLIEDVRKTIMSEATVRDETARKLATSLVLKYNMTITEETLVSKKREGGASKPKIAPPSVAQQVMKDSEGVMEVSELDNDEVTDAERERIMEEAVRKRYNMVDGIQSAAGDFPGDDPSYDSSEDSIFSEGAANPLLERERLVRLQKQKQAMEGGSGGSFRRSG